jgi:hypothetical protein
MRLLLLILALSLSVAAQTSAPRIAPQLLGGLQWRSIGPAMFGGRVADVAGVPGNPNLLFVAHSSGGLFKLAGTAGGRRMRSLNGSAAQRATRPKGRRLVAADDRSKHGHKER